jgi:hypothetical protein
MKMGAELAVKGGPVGEPTRSVTRLSSVAYGTGTNVGAGGSADPVAVYVLAVAVAVAVGREEAEFVEVADAEGTAGAPAMPRYSLPSESVAEEIRAATGLAPRLVMAYSVVRVTAYKTVSPAARASPMTPLPPRDATGTMLTHVPET